jgi:hypothetical protein
MVIFEDVKVHVRFKLAALWASVMFLYVYGDYFGLYQPGFVHELEQGKLPVFGAVTQVMLLGFSIMMTVPSVMIFLSLALTPNVNRWLNVIAGSVYTLIIIATLPGSWMFTIFLAFVEIVLTLLVVWYAWRWPAVPASDASLNDIDVEAYLKGNRRGR